MARTKAQAMAEEAASRARVTRSSTSKSLHEDGSASADASGAGDAPASISSKQEGRSKGQRTADAQPSADKALGSTVSGHKNCTSLYRGEDAQ